MFLDTQKLLTAELCGAVVCGLVQATTAKALLDCDAGGIELFRAHFVVYNEIAGGLEAPLLPEDVCRRATRAECMYMHMGALKPASLGRDIIWCIPAQKQPL